MPIMMKNLMAAVNVTSSGTDPPAKITQQNATPFVRDATVLQPVTVRNV